MTEKRYKLCLDHMGWFVYDIVTHALIRFANHASAVQYLNVKSPGSAYRY